jgi:hypothetical protein
MLDSGRLYVLPYRIEHCLCIDYLLFNRVHPIYHSREAADMQTLKQMMHHPAGRIGLTVGLVIGFVAALMGEASKALLFAGLCRFLAGRIARR